MKEWAVTLAGALAWFASLCISFAAVPPACADRSNMLLMLIPAVAIGISALAAALSWRRWREQGGDFPAEEAVAGHRALASGGVLLNVFFILVLIAQMIAPGVLGVCE